MNTLLKSLPSSIEDIIDQYTHQLKMKDVMDELKKHSYFCFCCFRDRNEKIIYGKKLRLCECCDEPICEDCFDNFVEGNNGELCNECFYHNIIHSMIDKIIGAEMTDEQFDLFIHLIISLDIMELDILADYIYHEFDDILEGEGDYLSFQLIYNYIDFFIIEEFDNEYVN